MRAAGARPGDAKRQESTDPPWIGATDLHVHCGPEGIPRRFDAVQLAEHVAQSGLRSLVMKSHFTMTSDWAQMAHRLTGVRLFGSVTLNHHVGGINPLAVRAALGPRDASGPFLKVVWLPTIHAAAHLVARSARGDEHDIPAEWAGGILPDVAERISDVPPISLFDPSVHQALDAVLRLIAQHDLVLATGHVGRDEVFFLMERAQRVGIRRIVVTHPAHDPPGLSLGDMQALAAAGAFIELSYILLDMGSVTVKETARTFREVGAARIVLTTDFGQVDRMTPAEGLARFGAVLADDGIGWDEIALAMKTNPRRLVGDDAA
jgi:Family of unknown function (DUF6282)